MNTEKMIAEDEADIQAMRELSDDVTADEYAKGVALFALLLVVTR